MVRRPLRHYERCLEHTCRLILLCLYAKTSYSVSSRMFFCASPKIKLPFLVINVCIYLEIRLRYTTDITTV